MSIDDRWRLQISWARQSDAATASFCVDEAEALLETAVRAAALEDEVEATREPARQHRRLGRWLDRAQMVGCWAPLVALPWLLGSMVALDRLDPDRVVVGSVVMGLFMVAPYVWLFTVWPLAWFLRWTGLAPPSE
jgi:hypothetical protein